MKAVVLIVGVLTGAMFFTSLIVTTRLTGTLNPAETVKLIGEPYEESSDFSNTVESYMLQVLDRNDRVDHWHFDCGSACLVDLPQNKEENAAAGEYAGGTGASVCGKAFIGR